MGQGNYFQTWTQKINSIVHSLRSLFWTAWIMFNIYMNFYLCTECYFTSFLPLSPEKIEIKVVYRKRSIQSTPTASAARWLKGQARSEEGRGTRLIPHKVTQKATAGAAGKCQFVLVALAQTSLLLLNPSQGSGRENGQVKLVPTPQRWAAVTTQDGDPAESDFILLCGHQEQWNVCARSYYLTFYGTNLHI